MATRAVVICKYDTFIVFYTQVLVARFAFDVSLEERSICFDDEVDLH